MVITYKISGNNISVTINKIVKDTVDDFEKKFMDKLQELFLSEMVDIIANNLMKIYAEEMSPYSTTYDEANPMNPEVMNLFRDSMIVDMVSSFQQNFGKNKAGFGFGDMEKLGYNLSSGAIRQRLGKINVKDSGRDFPFYWLIFYLEGVAGKYYFVTESDFKKFHEAGFVSEASLGKFKDWGWYGKGFLIPEAAYKSGLNVKSGTTGKGFDNVPGVTPKVHPFSGIKPVRLFERALEDINIDAFIDKVINSI